MQKEAKRRGIQRRVFPLGKLNNEDLAKVYRQACALVLPSVNEGFGLPAIEGLACGIPVIVSDIPAFREVLGNQGVYFDLISTESLKIILESETLRKKNVRQEIRNQYVKAGKKYNWKSTSKKVLSLYKCIVEKNE